MRELTRPSPPRTCGPGRKRALVEAVIIAAICFGGSVLFNALRDDGIAFIHKTPYDIMVPCPETLGEVDTLQRDVLARRDARVLVIDAREESDYRLWHVDNSMHLPFDYLEPVLPCQLKTIVTSGARQVVVYGDGEAPDSGEQLARELAGSGIRNVGFIQGGIKAIRPNSDQFPGGQP